MRISILVEDLQREFQEDPVVFELMCYSEYQELTRILLRHGYTLKIWQEEE